jgi:type IV secretory pathway TrbF-like protein
MRCCEPPIRRPRRSTPGSARNSPFEKAKTATVAIEVNNIVALSNQSYQIDWTEYERDRKGKETGRAASAASPP